MGPRTGRRTVLTSAEEGRAGTLPRIRGGRRRLPGGQEALGGSIGRFRPPSCEKVAPEGTRELGVRHRSETRQVLGESFVELAGISAHTEIRVPSRGLRFGAIGNAGTECRFLGGPSEGALTPSMVVSLAQFRLRYEEPRRL